NTMGNSRDDEGGITEGSQRDKGDAIGEVVYQVPSDLKRQARFAHARRAGEGEQAHFWAQEQRLDRLHLLLTANKLCEGDRQSRPDKLGFVTWRELRKDDNVILHIQSLPHVQAIV